MNCYLCDSAGQAAPAVAVCSHCGIALCRTHLDQDLLATRAQGVVRRGCTHQPLHWARARSGPHAAPGVRDTPTARR